MKASGSKEVGRVGEESNAMDSIRVVEFDPRVLREPRQMEIDFVNQLDVLRHPSMIFTLPSVNDAERTQSCCQTTIALTQTGEDFVGHGLHNHSFSCVIPHLTLQHFSLRPLSPS